MLVGFSYEYIVVDTDLRLGIGFPEYCFDRLHGGSSQFALYGKSALSASGEGFLAVKKDSSWLYGFQDWMVARCDLA
jgi:hypothetical protein